MKNNAFFESEREIPIIVVDDQTLPKSDWESYAVHDDTKIKGFFGDYRWLSNFHRCPVFYEGLKYPSSENAYQAAKVDQDFRHHLQECSPSASKKLWKNLPRIDISKDEWDRRKYDVMAVILFDKFFRNGGLRRSLLETGDKFLEETNHWGDSCWGFDINKNRGTNHLGQLLMFIRKFWSLKP